MNVSATVSIFRLLRDPSLCLPHHTIPTFQQLPIPISQAFENKETKESSTATPGKKVDIRAVVLDKDNCFAAPGENHVYKPYEEKLHELQEAYPGAKLLIVSNSAGSKYSDPFGQQAALLEENTGIPVLRHSTKKPGTYPSIIDYFTNPRHGASSGVTHPSQIVVVGDRLFTDVMMANMMGSWSIWVRDGVVQEKGVFVRAERHLEGFLRRRGYHPPDPGSNISNPFE